MLTKADSSWVCPAEECGLGVGVLLRLAACAFVVTDLIRWPLMKQAAVEVVLVLRRFPSNCCHAFLGPHRSEGRR